MSHLLQWRWETAVVVPFPEGTLRRTRERTARLAGAPDRSGFQAELHLDAGLVSRSLGSTRGGVRVGAISTTFQ